MLEDSQTALLVTDNRNFSLASGLINQSCRCLTLTRPMLAWRPEILVAFSRSRPNAPCSCLLGSEARLCDRSQKTPDNRANELALSDCKARPRRYR
jgi:hypothetical protein